MLLATALAGCGGGSSLVVSPTPVAAPSVVASPSASVATGDASCTPVENVGPYQPKTQDAQHVADGQAPPLESYASSPPTSGPHAAVTQPAGAYAVPISWEQAIHSLEHGAAVIWYDPAADPASIAQVRTLVESDDDHTIMAPFTYPEQGPAGALPEGTEMALVAWHRLQTCDRLEPAVVDAFLSAYRAPPQGRGNLPRRGSRSRRADLACRSSRWRA